MTKRLNDLTLRTVHLLVAEEGGEVGALEALLLLEADVAQQPVVEPLSHLHAIE